MNNNNFELKDTKSNKIVIPNFVPLDNSLFKNLKLDDAQKQILFGGLLGDLYLQLQSGGKNYRLRVQQQYPKHEEYVLQLFDVFKSFCSAQPDKVERKKNKTIDIRFQTRSHPEFNDFGQLFYLNNKKILPNNYEIDKWLTAKSFTYWYMDDGGIETDNPNACSLSTHSFEFDHVERLIVILNQKFNLEAYSRFNKDKKIIIIPAKSCPKIKNLLIPNIVKCMKYKIPGEK